jgi:hypothetical protein
MAVLEMKGNKRHRLHAMAAGVKPVPALLGCGSRRPGLGGGWTALDLPIPIGWSDASGRELWRIEK